MSRYKGTAIPVPAGLKLFTVVLTLAITLLPHVSFALTVPEKLVFDLTWTGIFAGRATQEITADGKFLKVLSTARSADWISAFYAIEDRIESTLTTSPVSGLGVPQHYRMRISEGKHRRDKEIAFDSARAKAYYTDNISGEKAVIPITSHTYDVYSSFYYVRFAKLEVGKSVFVNLLDSKETWNLEVKVVKKERIKTKKGYVDTLLLKPLVRKEGVFENKGNLLIWLSDDNRRLPVKMQASVAIGSITATLVNME